MLPTKVFYDNGIKSEYDMMDYAKNNTALVKKVSVTKVLVEVNISSWVLRHL